jgi:DNA replication protein DnaC
VRDLPSGPYARSGAIEKPRSPRAASSTQFREPDETLDNFDFDFNKKMNRRLVFELATGQFIDRREDALFLGPPGTGKSHLAQAIGLAAIRQGHRVLYRETHILLEELADATIDGSRKDKIMELQTILLLIVDDLGMRKLPATAAEDLLEVVMRRHERASTLMTPDRPVEDWGKLLGDTPGVAAMLDRLLHHGHVLKCGPRSWRTKNTATLRKKTARPTPVPGLLHRPVLTRSPLAAFQVLTEGESARVFASYLTG